MYAQCTPEELTTIAEATSYVMFKSGMIGELHFLPDWQTSDGAVWERRQGELLGIDIHDIPEDVAATLV